MPSFSVTLNPYTFVSIPLFIIGLTSVLYLLRIKTKTADIWAFIGAMGGITLGMAAMFVTTGLVLWGAAFWPMQDASAVSGMVAMILFAFYFPKKDPALLPRLAVLFGLALSLMAWGYSLYYAYQVLLNRNFEVSLHPAYPFFMPLTFLRR